LIARAPRWALFAAALAIGFAIVLLSNGVIDLILGEPVFGGGAFGTIQAVDVAILRIVLASLPMLVLALLGSRSDRLWGTATVLTFAFWTYMPFQIWRDSLTGFAGGANIGLGLIMLASPFIILFLLAIVALVARWTR
jgi:hypothetical protein